MLLFYFEALFLVEEFFISEKSDGDLSAVAVLSCFFLFFLVVVFVAVNSITADKKDLFLLFQMI